MTSIPIKYLASLFFIYAVSTLPVIAQSSKGFRLGYAINVSLITPETMRYAKSVGIDCIEVGIGYFVEKKTLDFKHTDEEAIAMVKKAQKAATDAGIEIWSVHMPFSDVVDLSLANDTARTKVLSLHKKILEYCRLLKPRIILFHPSFFLGLNERELRKQQFIKSATELNKIVADMGATMVIENMLGDQLLLAGGKRERPLFRTVEESVEIMNRLPKTIYSAIDLNHIKNPEKLILALGARLKTLHVADGNGEEECHYLPCNGRGKNNWNAIFAALQQVNYSGPFMFECAADDVKEYKKCYELLYSKFVTAK